jgi:hypothetical protein
MKIIKTHQHEFIKAIKEDDEPTMRRLLETGQIIFNWPLPLGAGLPLYPLCVAAFYGSFKGINLLTDYGAKIDFDKDECTPLKWAIMSSNSNLDAILLLLDRGATSPNMIEDLFNYERPDTEVKTILRFMLRKKIITQGNVAQIILDKFFHVSLELFTVLFAITNNPNIIDMHGDTVLFPIVNIELTDDKDIRNRHRMIKGLIKLGIDPTIKNYYGLTAADCAVSPEIRTLLSS